MFYISTHLKKSNLFQLFGALAIVTTLVVIGPEAEASPGYFHPYYYYGHGYKPSIISDADIDYGTTKIRYLKKREAESGAGPMNEGPKAGADPGYYGYYNYGRYLYRYRYGYQPHYLIG